MISIYRLFHPFGCPSVTAGVGGEGWERGLDLKDSTGEEASTVAVTEGWGCGTMNSNSFSGRLEVHRNLLTMDDGPLGKLPLTEGIYQ